MEERKYPLTELRRISLDLEIIENILKQRDILKELLIKRDEQIKELNYNIDRLITQLENETFI